MAEFTARRTRQYPVDFGYTSTFVEVVDEPQLIDAARRLLGSIAHHGLVEVEFKRDPRDGSMKVLDVNPRPWTWFGLAAAAGVDLGAMLWAIKSGHKIETASARPNTSWMYLVRDMVAAGKLISRGRLTIRAYLRLIRIGASMGDIRGERPHAGPYRHTIDCLESADEADTS